MARKRKADHDAVIASAIGLFWNHGYAGASTREIEKETGLTRFTLQTVYGGKEKFFLDALDAYLDGAEATHFPQAESFTLGDLAGWFERLADAERMPRIGDSGCLAFNSIAEFGRDHGEVNKRIERYLNALEGRVKRILQRADAGGQLRAGLDLDACSRVAVSLLLGLHGIIKARSDDTLPQAHARSIAALIRSWGAGG